MKLLNWLANRTTTMQFATIMSVLSWGIVIGLIYLIYRGMR